MPWNPELFSIPALARIWEDERRRRLALVPFFAGLMTGETEALVDSFADAAASIYDDADPPLSA